MGQGSSGPVQQYSKKGENWASLPNEVLIRIFSFLSLVDLSKVASVCKRFKTLSEQDEIWRSLYIQRFDFVYVDETTVNFKKLYKLELLGTSERTTFHLNNSSTKWCCLGGPSKEDTQMIRLRTAERSAKVALHEGVKLVILGDVSTGKTSILIRLVKGIFHSYHEATIGASFLTKQMVLGGVPVKLKIWDTAGSERYHSIVPMYYRGATAALVVFDITNAESFDRAQRWISELEREITPKPFIVLVGNKVDLEKHRDVKKQNVMEYANKKEIPYIETSAKTGHNIVDVFKLVASTLIERAEEMDRDPMRRKNMDDGF